MSMFFSPKKGRNNNNANDGMLQLKGSNIHMPTDEIRACRHIFKVFDGDGADSLSPWQLRLALESLGLNPSEEQVNGSRSKVTFPEFLELYQKQKEFEKAQRDPQELLLAFSALAGGNIDGTGRVSITLLQTILKDYGLVIKIEDLIEELDSDAKDISFEQFCFLLS
jgi:Ca2+-binding EF-hand superfamily protein